MSARALRRSAQGKIHHFAFGLKDWSEILHAGQIFSMDDVSVDIGPTQHGITRGETIYFFEPAGNRNEVFVGGYEAYPDRPEWLDMYTAILQDESMGPRYGWFRTAVTQTDEALDHVSRA